MTLSRRKLLARSSAAGFGIAVTGLVDALFTANSVAGNRGPAHSYGPLISDPAEVLDLPVGFRYTVISREGQPLRSGGGTVPSKFDGMATFPDSAGHTRLVRNHECESDPPHPVVASPSHSYDPGGKGGTSTLLVDSRHQLRAEWVSLGGTTVNCAGGRTPWRTWLSCEEIEDRAGTAGYTKDHGFVFEVDPYHNHRNTNPTPLTAMGRFEHEAVAVDPRTGIVYETEDADNDYAKSLGLFYRFLPAKPLGGYDSLRAGGVLEAMRVPGVTDLSEVQEVGTMFPSIEWVRVPDPLATTEPTREQDYGSSGITRAQKLECAWWGDDMAYFVSSYGRAAKGSKREHDGQGWRYDPKANALELTVIFTRSPDTPADQLFQAPDNICVSPYGGLLIAQDGNGKAT